MKPSYHTYYDKIFSQKKYNKEAKIIIDIFRSIRHQEPQHILDIGCGTGNHALEFGRLGFNVVGVDTDRNAILIANKKRSSIDGLLRIPHFICGEIRELRAKNFDLATALFNVINYVPGPQALVRFFRAIHSRLRPKGVFIFDCWNGIAALREPPRRKHVLIDHQGERLRIKTYPEKLDLLRQFVQMRSEIVITRKAEQDRFAYQYCHRLWTPWELTEFLTAAGFSARCPTKWMNPHRLAGTTDWKILFICLKK